MVRSLEAIGVKVRRMGYSRLLQVQGIRKDANGSRGRIFDGLSDKVNFLILFRVNLCYKMLKFLQRRGI
jgi:hypothetical protein